MLNNLAEDSLDNEILYCICQKSTSDYTQDDLMIECDSCKDWLHGRCINVNQFDAADIETFICSRCSNNDRKTVFKKRGNYHRHDFYEVDADKKSIQAGTPVFINNLLKKCFSSSDELVVKLDGEELKIDYLERNGFHKPMLVKKKDNLDLKVPASEFNLDDLEELIGSEYELEVIDVEKQQTVPMKMNAFKNYFKSPQKNKIYNLISLEISKTKLNELVTMPKIVREISWASCGIVPEKILGSGSYQPDVQKYCLISAKNSYTDFHIDFGGSSVWYHVLKGNKIFYLIEPTKNNLELYENWASKPNHTEILLSDQVEKCYICELTEGNTIFLPTGYIHAVYTPSDSIVFGGNFEHSYNISLQLKIYELENRLKVPQKFRFPGFQILHWYAGQHFAKTLKVLNKKNIPVQEYLYFGCKVLKNTLKKWYYNKKEFNEETDGIPADIQCEALIRTLSKELKKSQVLLSKIHKTKRKLNE